MPYAPTIIPNSSPFVTVTSAGGLTYQELLNALGSWNFKVNKIYMQADSIEQILQVIQYNKFDSTGYVNIKPIVSNIDPYQRQAAIVIDTKAVNIILDGFSSLNFDILPNENIQMVFEADEVSSSAELDKLHKSNIQQVLN